MRSEATLERIRSDHAILRVIIERFRDAAAAARAGRSAQELRDAGRTLCLVLEAHAAVEEDLLKSSCPTVHHTRIGELHDKHAATVTALQRLKGRDTISYAAIGLRLARHLLDALDSEEREFLGDAASVGVAVAS
jgi:5-carboxymethyl-2-hydroxymuconate isomerase